jgi:hypothetical protein
MKQTLPPHGKAELRINNKLNNDRDIQLDNFLMAS